MHYNRYEVGFCRLCLRLARVSVDAGYQQGTKRKADEDVYFSESSVPSSHSDDSNEPILVESSESEPEVDCDEWDSDCRVVEVTPQGKPICGCKRLIKTIH